MQTHSHNEGQPIMCTLLRISSCGDARSLVICALQVCSNKANKSSCQLLRRRKGSLTTIAHHQGSLARRSSSATGRRASGFHTRTAGIFSRFIRVCLLFVFSYQRRGRYVTTELFNILDFPNPAVGRGGGGRSRRAKCPNYHIPIHGVGVTKLRGVT